jgi:site-specific DNA recombinase
MTRRIATAGPLRTTSQKTAVLYLRVSTKEQASRGGEAEGFSIPAQREVNTRKAESLDAIVVEEFVDAGESARSSKRPKLQLMLEYIREHHVDYVIVHKVDRLARNRADDVQINLALKAAGVQLVSATENIDETPSGMLVHGIMSSIAEFYSQNLANESRKGMLQKAKSGGTPGMAPFGYLNVRKRNDEGYEIRTVEVDTERAMIVQECFERYATGDWTETMLYEDLKARGITTLPRPKKPAKPIAKSQINSMLRNRYYIGYVKFDGIEFEGSHPRLIDEALFQRVQDVRAGRVQSREKPRVHVHYLKGSVFCARCGEPFSFAVSRNHQGKLYEYMFCLGRQSLKNGCDQRAIPADMVEDLVEGHWRTVTLTERTAEQIRAAIWEHVQVVLPLRTREIATAQAQVDRLDNESKKLLQAHYSDAITLDMLREEQARIAIERARAQQALDLHTLSAELMERQLSYWTAFITHADRHYRAADDVVRRQLNQSVFERIWLDEDEVVGSDLTPVYRRMLADDLESELAHDRARAERNHFKGRDLYAVPDHAPMPSTGDLRAPQDLPRRDRRHTTIAPLNRYLRAERPRGRLDWERKNPGPSKDRGSNNYFLVAGAGFEPATSGL